MKGKERGKKCFVLLNAGLHSLSKQRTTRGNLMRGLIRAALKGKQDFYLEESHLYCNLNESIRAGKESTIVKLIKRIDEWGRQEVIQ